MAITIINKIEKLDNGDFISLAVNGSAEWTVPLTANDITVNGLVKCMNGITCKSFRCMGTAKLGGEIKLEKIYCDGALSVDNENFLHFAYVFCTGALKAKNDICIDKININGSVNVTDGSFSAKEINNSGSIVCSGSINTETIKSNGYIFAEKISAEYAKLTYNKNVADRVLKKNHKLNPVLPLIEAAEVDLTNVQAFMVRGKKVTIKSGCIIDSVQYSDELIVDDNAEIGSIEKVDVFEI